MTKREERLAVVGLKLEMIRPSWSMIIFEEDLRKEYPERYRQLDKWRRQYNAYLELSGINKSKEIMDA